MKAKKKYSVKSRIIGIVMLCWIVPILLTLGLVGYYVFSNHFANKASAQLGQIISDDNISVERLNGLVSAAKEITYDREVENAFKKYKKNEISQRTLLDISHACLHRTFEGNIKIKDAILWYHENPLEMYSNIYNDGSNGSYYEVAKYWNEDHRDIAAYAATLDTSIGFWRKGSRLYLVRNLVDRAYNPIGVLVLRVNKGYCFDKVINYPSETEITIKLDDCIIPLQGKSLDGSIFHLKGNVEASGYEWVDGKLHFFHRLEGQGYWMETTLRFMDASSFMPFYGYQFVVIGMLLLALPLLWLCLKISNKHIAAPIEAMVAASREMENGSLGYQIEKQAESKEFDYLINTFNEMSAKIKEQFTQLYEEEIALKDAKIMALQSHINPHFMNNTLEIINWEARMEGNERVSQMIGALSTLMDATIDRKKKPEVPLSEEMVYVNAYLYITSRRLGSRLEVINNLPENIMQYKVPRLILQPIIENAVEHGPAKHKHGTVCLNGYKEGKYLYIEIINDSALSKEDEAKIARLLDFNYDTSKEPSGNMGIANVNQRLRILYGEPCGLTIHMDDSNHVISRLTILAEKDNKIIQ